MLPACPESLETTPKLAASATSQMALRFGRGIRRCAVLDYLFISLNQYQLKPLLARQVFPCISIVLYTPSAIVTNEASFARSSP
jgi:hypothetical protein